MKSRQSRVKVFAEIYKILGVGEDHIRTLSNSSCEFCEYFKKEQLLPLNSVHFSYQLKVSNIWNFFFFLLISATGKKSVNVWWNVSWLHNKCKHTVLPSEGHGK